MKPQIAQLLDNLEGKPNAGLVEVTERGARFPNEQARLVKLENWHLEEDLVTPNTVDVLWGYNGQYVHWLRAGGNTELLPISNLQDISIRTKAGESVLIFYSWYK